MQAAVHIGRVGGLAIALGVGFAVFTGMGVAAAETTDSSDSSASSTKSSERSERESKSEKAETSEKAEKADKKESAADASKAGNETKKKRRTAGLDESEDKSEDKDKDKAETKAEPKPSDSGPDDEGDKPAGAAVAKALTATAPTTPKAVEQIRTAVVETVSAPGHVVKQVLSSVKLEVPLPPRPSAPQQSSLLVALTALGTRRDTEARSLSTGASAAVPMAAAAAVATPATTRIGWVTGANSINSTVKRFGIAGTDIGVMWDNGITKDNKATAIVEQRQILMAFGDTFANPGMTGNWRNNVLLRSADRVLADGLYVPNGVIHDPGAYSGSPMTIPNISREIIGKYGYAVGPEVTIIPTAGISVAGAGANGATRQYVNFMSVRSWDTPGKWTTNYSGVIWSDDNGQNWTVVPASGIRPAAAGRSTRPFINGNQNFQQGAYVKPPAGTTDAAAGWVYSYGTPAGRNGTVYLSRVNDKQILDQTKYEYWNGSSWTKNNPAAAKPVLPGTTTTSWFGMVKNTTYPTAGEMSVQYNPYVKKYVMLYTDSGNNVVMRTSSTPQGTWSAPKTLVTSSQYPGLYAPMIHPWSGSSQLKKADGTTEDPQMLYWNLSQWNEYNVALMRTDLSRV